MKAKHRGRILTFFCVLWMSTLCAAGQEEELLPIYFFHNTACGSCDGTEEFVQTVRDQISYYKEDAPYELLMYNVFKTGGLQEWEKVKETYGLEKEDYFFPVMVLDGVMYTGMDQIKSELHRAYLQASDIAALYFYREDCQECIDMEPFWKTVSEELQNGTLEAEGRILALESRTGENGTRIRTLFEQYEVPQEDQMVPFVFLEEGYLAGQESIESELKEMLKTGNGFTKKTEEADYETLVSESSEVLE